MTHEEVIAYNLRDGGTAVTVFADTQTYRVDKARMFVQSALNSLPGDAVIVEPGCSAGDISGWFSLTRKASVLGIDVVPAAVQLARERYPAMRVIEGIADEMEPIPCDVLVLCEFLEHISDPVRFVKAWLPLARFAVIGHPLNDPGNVEPGHVWSYTLQDYMRWYEIGGHRPLETHLFSGPFPEMVMGIGMRDDR
jgi:hypothetical protein